MGGVVDLDFIGSHRETKLIAIDKQTNDNVMHLDGFGKADCFAREPLDACAQRQMLPFNLLRMTFARDMSFGGQMPGVRPPMIGEEACDPKRLQQGLELEEPFVLATAKHIRQDLSGPVIKGMPEPAWLLFLAHEAPHFVHLRSLHSAKVHFDVTCS